MMTAQLTHRHFRGDRLDLFWWFICERQSIWQRRFVQQLLPPWTADQTMQRERFTNVYRELDPGTQYAINEILERDAPKPDKIFNIMLYRLIGRKETHAAIGFQRLTPEATPSALWRDPQAGTLFDPQALERRLKYIRDVEKKSPFTAAYMVSAYTQMGSRDKIVNVVRLFDKLYRSFDTLYARIQACRSSAEVHALLCAVDGFGNFLAYQVLVDLLYPLRIYGNAPLLPYTHDDWASAGPGAQRGIAMLLKEGVQAEHLEVMRWLRYNQQAEFARLGLDFPYLRDDRGQPVEISLANIQNCLCEFHKYVKISEGTGRGRRKYQTAGAAAGGHRPPPSSPPYEQLSLAFSPS